MINARSHSRAADAHAGPVASSKSRMKQVDWARLSKSRYVARPGPPGEVFVGDRRDGVIDRQQQCMRALDLGKADGAAFVVQAPDVCGQALDFESGQ